LPPPPPRRSRTWPASAGARTMLPGLSPNCSRRAWPVISPSRRITSSSASRVGCASRHASSSRSLNLPWFGHRPKQRRGAGALLADREREPQPDPQRAATLRGCVCGAALPCEQSRVAPGRAVPLGVTLVREALGQGFDGSTFIPPSAPAGRLSQDSLPQEYLSQEALSRAAPSSPANDPDTGKCVVGTHFLPPRDLERRQRGCRNPFATSTRDRVDRQKHRHVEACAELDRDLVPSAPRSRSSHVNRQRLVVTAVVRRLARARSEWARREARPAKPAPDFLAAATRDRRQQRVDLGRHTVSAALEHIDVPRPVVIPVRITLDIEQVRITPLDQSS